MRQKTVIVGAGHVGAHVASALAMQEICEEIVLIDKDTKKAWAHAQDIQDTAAYVGREISNLCYEKIHTYAEAALREMNEGPPGPAFEQIVLTIVVNTGLVSHLVEDCYNCAVAHSVCYGLDRLPGISQRFLHGDLVGYGVLVQLALDGQEQEEREVRALLTLLGIPVSLAQMGIALTREALEPVLAETVAGPDMEHIPYPVTKEMVWEAMRRVEAFPGDIFPKTILDRSR